MKIARITSNPWVWHRDRPPAVMPGFWNVWSYQGTLLGEAYTLAQANLIARQAGHKPRLFLRHGQGKGIRWRDACRWAWQRYVTAAWRRAKAEG